MLHQNTELHDSKSFVTKHILGLLTQHWGQGTNILLYSFGSVSVSLSPSVFLCHMSPQHKLCKTRSSLQINRAQAQALSGQGRGWTRRLHTGHKQGNISYITIHHAQDCTAKANLENMCYLIFLINLNTTIKKLNCETNITGELITFALIMR